LFAGQLADHAFHLQVEERSQNLRRVQAGVFHEFVDVAGFFGGQQFVKAFFGRAESGGSQEVALLGFGAFGLYQRGADWGGQLFDHVFGVDDQLGALLDQQLRCVADGLSNVAGDAEHLAAEFHGEAGGDQGAAEFGAFDDDDTQGHTGDDAVPNWEIFGGGVGAQWKFAEDRATLKDSFVELLVFFRVANVNASAQDADGPAVGG
jgi:hypothetical protein